jgi:hypothetical protein
VFQGAEGGHCSVAKVLSTPDNLAYAVIEGLVAHLPSESNIDSSSTEQRLDSEPDLKLVDRPGWA